jgi:perosamine synthetase
VAIKFELESKFGSQYGTEEDAAVLDVLHKNAPTSGEACVQFEKDFAAYCGTKYARAVSNGTAALFLALKALDIKPGDRVLTTPLTWIATAAVVETLGATVDFVDIDSKTYNIDPNKLEKKLTPNTKAVIPVHLYGQCCDMDAIMALAKKHNFAVVEDACHAVGGEYKGKKAGSIGALGCFSFHEQKNISTLGEGGMVVTNDSALFERVALYRSHCARVYGSSTKYCTLDETKIPMGKRFWYQDFDDCGYNFRLTDIQGAVGVVQLKKVDKLNQRRRDIAQQISQGLKDVPGLTLAEEITPGKHVYHLYPIQLDAATYGMNKEDFIFAMLHDKNIKIGTHYTPLHYSTAFKNRGFTKGQFPVAEGIAERLVTMPIHPRLTDEAVAYLIRSIVELAKH